MTISKLQKARISVLIVTSLIIASCNQTNPSSRDHVTSNKTTINNTNKLQGTWSMCATSSGGLVTQMNVCPIIIFERGGNGYVKAGGIISESFNWSLEKDALKISPNTKLLSSTFTDKNYSVSFSEQKGRLDLIIRHDEDNFYLTQPLRR
ncbi:MAG: hypothetical protein QM726_15785 [Chitinophagaceae bacterium]